MKTWARPADDEYRRVEFERMDIKGGKRRSSVELELPASVGLSLIGWSKRGK